LIKNSELYSTLKQNTPSSVLLSFYSTLNIDGRSKHKKEQLLQALYSNTIDPAVSATIILGICGSSPGNILDVTSQIELRRAERIRKNLMLTVQSSLHSLRALNHVVTVQEHTNRKQLQYIDHLRDELGNAQQAEQEVNEEELMSQQQSQTQPPQLLTMQTDGFQSTTASPTSQSVQVRFHQDVEQNEVDQRINSQLRLQKRRKKFLSSRFATKQSLDSVFEGWRVPSVQNIENVSKSTPVVITLENDSKHEIENEHKDEKEG